MLDGFKNLQKSFDSFGSVMVEQVISGVGRRLQEADTDEEDTEGVEDGNLFFEDISDDLLGQVKTGPELSSSLAKVANKALQSKLKDAKYKEKDEKYLRPKNLEYASVPKVNKPVWEGMRRSNRQNDANLQQIQQDFLKASLPITEVISKLFKERDDPSKLDPKALVASLTDSLAFLGCANVNMIRKRKELIKNDLPRDMQRLCDESVEGSSDLLFGDDLNSQIKDVVELNKLSGRFSDPTRTNYDRFRYTDFRGRRSGRSSGFRHKKAPFRSGPYSTSRGSRRPLNRRGPSKD